VLAVADRNIPQLEEALAGVCEVRVLPSSEITRENVRDAELLFTRSTVKVGPALLDGSRVRFVATATIGTDHLDTPWLESRGMVWAAAPGSNADSVLQWFAAALLTLHGRGDLDVRKLRAGIVGVGNVGSRVERFCRALEIPILCCDPPRQAREGGDFVTLDEVLRECNLVTLHVPLDDSTRRFLDVTRVNGWLVNASRGEVVERLEAAAARLVLDVFDNEPSPSPSLIAKCALATPHIAGHSVQGKLNGTRMVYEAACRFLGREPSWQPRLSAPAPLTLEATGRSDEAVLLSAVEARYRVLDDDRALRDLAGGNFRHYRETYPERLELTGTPVTVFGERPRITAALSVLGAQLR
jgi:erythronate-4-phosphate dehydrogenase